MGKVYVMEEVATLKAADILTIGDDTPPEIIEDLDEYFSVFGPFRNEDGDPTCLNCGEKVNAFMQAAGLAVAYQWGLAHGEANCSGCGWPARGMHYIKDRNGEQICSISNIFLPYHPSHVTSQEQSQ